MAEGRKTDIQEVNEASEGKQEGAGAKEKKKKTEHIQSCYSGATRWNYRATGVLRSTGAVLKGVVAEKVASEFSQREKELPQRNLGPHCLALDTKWSVCVK